MKLICVLTLLILIVLSACQPTPETPPVASKNDGTLEKAIHEGASAGYVYTAPKSHSSTNSFCDGKVIINADNCTVFAAQGAVYPVYEAQSKRINKEMLINIYKVGFGESKMTFHSTQLAKDEIEQEIIAKKKELFDIKNGDYDSAQYALNVIINDDGREITEVSGRVCRAFSVNAIDGTVIDKYLGY